MPVAGLASSPGIGVPGLHSVARMTDDADTALTRAERKATTLFAATSVVVAVVVGAMLVSGWGGGRLENRIEVLYWAGAILGAVGVALLGIASVAGDRLGVIRGLTRAGVVLFMLGPVLCTVAVFTDYWI
jgi:drug/metabolite transporter (DMT)-like permease